jgi:hypothetical protein
MPNSELGFRLIKIADIGYITILYAISALFIAKLFDKLVHSLDTKENEEKTSLQLFIEIVLYLWLAGAILYAIRNLMELVPSPFEGIFGLEHKRVKELGNAGVFIFIFFYFGEALKKKLTVLYDRLLV